jgi:hypothetical protein
MNYWKISTGMLIICILMLSFFLYSNYNDSYDIDGLKIKKISLDDLSNNLDNKPFQLCDISTNKCLIFQKLK